VAAYDQVVNDLWNDERRRRRSQAAPLPQRVRPRSLDELVGQNHILGPGKLLRRMLEADRLGSIILQGPPGTGKTTLAELIATQTRAHFERANAAMVGVAQVRAILEAAVRRLEEDGRRTILFLDEIHRFSRSQQDILLGDVERGVITLVGATTENPYFAVNAALVSRATVFRLEPLSEAEIALVLRRAIDDERGYRDLDIEIESNAIDHWARICDGDARRALTALEIAVGSLLAEAESMHADTRSEGRDERLGALRVTLEVAQDSIQQKALAHDPTGDSHYDLASALIKSMRASDPDAAIHWLARMLEAGEDPRFVARRIAILASEDIGNADPRAIEVAAAAWTITERVGMPECQLTLAQAAIYMAAAPKSNASAKAIWAAMDDVRNGRTVPVPMAIRDMRNRTAAEREHRSGAREEGVEKYTSPHDGDDTLLDCLGVDRNYYRPTGSGFEARIAERLAEPLGARRRARRAAATAEE